MSMRHGRSGKWTFLSYPPEPSKRRDVHFNVYLAARLAPAAPVADPRLLERDFEVPMAAADEALLIERLKRRDERAFNEIVRLYETKVFGLVYRMLGNRGEAEDVAQD